jgi:uncharacterized protein (TIGR02246 family)
MKSSIVTLLALALVSSPLAADTKDDIVAVEKSSFKAWANHDQKAYGDTMADDPILIAASGNVFLGKQKILADLSSESDDLCEVKSFDLADTKVRQLSPDIAVLTYNLTQDATCKASGKLATKAFVTSIYVRQGGKWRWASYQETALKK